MYLEQLTPLARWKLEMLEYGIDCDDNIIKDFPGLKNMKSKFKYKIPKVEAKKFFDASKSTILMPSEIILEHGGHKTLVKVSDNPDSKFRLIARGKGLAIVDKGTAVPIDLKISAVPKLSYNSVEFDGRPMEEYVQVLGLDRMGILAYEGCYHWNIGSQCRFCDSNPKRNWEELAMPSVNALPAYSNDIAEWWKHYKGRYLKGIEHTLRYILDKETIAPHKHLQVMAGNLLDQDWVWKIFSEVSASINKVAPLKDFDSYINAIAPKKENRTYFLNKARNEWGFRHLEINLEVIGDKRFKEVCPGKSSLVGYQNSVDTLIEAVGIFGPGHARSNFVLGAQPIDELKEGIEFLASKGVVADYSVFIPKKYTPWADHPRPSIEDVASFTIFLAGIYEKYGFSGIYCGLSSRSNILHEVLKKI